jgi:hypothetical protein
MNMNKYLLVDIYIRFESQKIIEKLSLFHYFTAETFIVTARSYLLVGCLNRASFLK